jgi:hypothetical protein
MKELIEKLNALQIDQESYEWTEDLPDDIYNEYFTDIEEVASELDIDKHRWYETSVSVYKIGDEFLGVESVTDVFSESMGYSDCGHTLNFFEMEEFVTISYRAK